jgi:hypothetical protein
MRQKVLIMRCGEYDPEKISGIIKEGTEALCVKPSGRILFKPNVVIAHPEIFPRGGHQDIARQRDFSCPSRST